MAGFVIGSSVGRRGLNWPRDVQAVQERLNAIGKPCGAVDGVCGARTVAAIEAVQRHFMRRPDGLISPGGPTFQFLASWQDKPVDAGVDLRGNLRRAWDTLGPLLPKGSHCTSGYRSAEEQRRILHKMFAQTYKAQLVAKYGRKTYDRVWEARETSEDEMLAMVRAMGQAIAKPGQSPHQRGKAFDIGGPAAIDAQQVRVARLVAAAHPELFNGKVLKERNGCVHVEIR